MRYTAFVLAVVLSAPAMAQYKCVKGGVTMYQDAPCKLPGDMGQGTAAQASQQGQAAPPVAQTNAASQQEAARLKAFFAQRDDDRRREKIATLEREVVSLQSSMDRELALLRLKKSTAANNLAGATWEQSISTEMQAVTARYQEQISAKREQIKVIQGEIGTGR